MYREGKLILVNQSLWLFDHSGMKIPSDLLFEKVYQEEIVERMNLYQTMPIFTVPISSGEPSCFFGRISRMWFISRG